MTYALTVLIVLAAGYFVGHRMGVRSGRFDMQFKKQRADDLFRACDLQLNAMSVKYSQALMEIEDLKAVKRVVTPDSNHP